MEENLKELFGSPSWQYVKIEPFYSRMATQKEQFTS